MLLMFKHTCGVGEFCDCSHLWKVDRRADAVRKLNWDRARTEPVGPTLESLLEKTLAVAGINEMISIAKTGLCETKNDERRVSYISRLSQNTHLFHLSPIFICDTIHFST